MHVRVVAPTNWLDRVVDMHVTVVHSLATV
jgi:hypothetical protein